MPVFSVYVISPDSFDTSTVMVKSCPLDFLFFFSLLSIQVVPGVEKRYALKDKSGISRSSGSITLCCDLVFNPVSVLALTECTLIHTHTHTHVHTHELAHTCAHVHTYTSTHM